MITSYLHGHKVTSENYGKDWFYEDGTHTKKIPLKKCPKCDRLPTKKGHDPCLADLPGVKFACCGHGVEKGYITFKDGTVIRGKFKIEEEKCTHLVKSG